MLTTNFNSNSMRRGLSLVEVLVAMTMTLIVLGAMMAAFSYGSVQMQKGRAAIDMVTRLQAAEELLRRDLGGVTVDVKPYQDLAPHPNGYFEIVDGPRRDYNVGDFAVDPITNSDQSYLGDTDDFIAFTVKSTGKPFRGRNAGGVAESHYAEVVWFLDAPTRKLYRRVLLVRPDVGAPGGLAGNDISRGAGGAANSLAELGYRHNRFSHVAGGTPMGSNVNQLGIHALINSATGLPIIDPIIPAGVLTAPNPAFLSTDNDVVLSNVVAFDVQVYDPDAYQFVVGAGGAVTDIAEPSDIGPIRGTAPGSISQISRGTFVDLGKVENPLPGTGLQNGLPALTTPSILYNPPNGGYTQDVYDTGTSWYDNDVANDFGSNGVDDNNNGIVDDVGEKAAIAPYNVPLRGVKITIRVVEPRSKQVRQLTVKQSFVQ